MSKSPATVRLSSRPSVGFTDITLRAIEHTGVLTFQSNTSVHNEHILSPMIQVDFSDPMHVFLSYLDEVPATIVIFMIEVSHGIQSAPYLDSSS